MIKADNIQYLHDVDSDLELIMCNNSNLSYPLHNHISVFTIGMVLDGSILLSTNHSTHIYNKNCTFIIPPYMPHSIKANDRYSLLSLCIRKNLIECSCNSINKLMLNITNLLVGALGSNRIEEGMLSRLLSCVHSLNDTYPVPPMFKSDLCIDRLQNQLELYPENRFSVEEMARAALTSKYNFIRRFKQIVGLTPHQFQIQNRIRKAQRLIIRFDTITEVALTTGFCDQSHFIKQFKKQVGITPSNYKLSVGIIKPNPNSSKVPE